MDHSDINSSASEGCQSCKRRKVPRQTWSPERPTMTQEIAPADYQSSSDSSGCESTSWRSRPSHVKSFSNSNTHLQRNTLPSTNQMPSPSSRLNRTLSQYSLPRPPNSMHASQPSRSPANQYMPESIRKQYPGATESQMREAIAGWLAGSRDRDQGRKEREDARRSKEPERNSFIFNNCLDYT